MVGLLLPSDGGVRGHLGRPARRLHRQCNLGRNANLIPSERESEIYVYKYVYVSMYLCLYMYIVSYIALYMRIYVCMCLNLCPYLCIYIYVYI